MRKYFLLIIIVIWAFSCKDRVISKEEHGYNFYPRKVSYMVAGISKQVVINYYPDGSPNTDYIALDENVARNNEWLLSVWTTNCKPDTLQDLNLYPKILDPSIPEVERLLSQDYEKTFFKQYSNGLRSSSGESFNFIDIEYRTSSIVNLSIRSLNTPLFGKQTGDLLNDFFDVVSYRPAIISTPQYNLIYGYANRKSINMPIDEWLSLNPIALEDMYLALNKPISGLPIDVRFVVEMETGEGLVLRDTTQLFTITE